MRRTATKTAIGIQANPPVPPWEMWCEGPYWRLSVIDINSPEQIFINPSEFSIIQSVYLEKENLFWVHQNVLRALTPEVRQRIATKYRSAEALLEWIDTVERSLGPHDEDLLERETESNIPPERALAKKRLSEGFAEADPQGRNELLGVFSVILNDRRLSWPAHADEVPEEEAWNVLRRFGIPKC